VHRFRPAGSQQLPGLRQPELRWFRLGYDFQRRERAQQPGERSFVGADFFGVAAPLRCPSPSRSATRSLAAVKTASAAIAPNTSPPRRARAPATPMS
jgi:hypothetical protein